MILLTSTLSPISSVFSIDDDGMKKGCTTKVLITNAMAMATTMRMGSSRQVDRDRPLAALLVPGPAGPDSSAAPASAGAGSTRPDSSGPDPSGAVSGSSSSPAGAGSA